MYLLIRNAVGCAPVLKMNLHSIMYLLILLILLSEYGHHHHLHSIMYLLIHTANGNTVTVKKFTFHNVSINSQMPMMAVEQTGYLHSIMYLLIRSLLH